MAEETFTYRLDLYYLATIVYVLTFVVYVAIRGSLTGGRFEVALSDPIVYVLGITSLVSLVALLTAAILRRRVIIGDHELVFQTRFKRRVFSAEDIESIAFGPLRRVRSRRDRPDTDARLKLRTRRRRMRLYAGSFEHSTRLMRALARWAEANHVVVRRRRPEASRR